MAVGKTDLGGPGVGHHVGFCGVCARKFRMVEDWTRR